MQLADTGCNFGTVKTMQLRAVAEIYALRRLPKALAMWFFFHDLSSATGLNISKDTSVVCKRSLNLACAYATTKLIGMVPDTGQHRLPVLMKMA